MSALTQAFNSNTPEGQAALDYALVKAVAHGQAQEVTELIQNGASVNWQSTRRKKSLLQVAALHGHTGVVNALLAAGAPLDARDKSGRTALFEALHLDHLAIAHALLDAKANPNLRTNSGMSPAVWPVSRCHMDIIEKLLENGLDLAARDGDQCAMIFHACSFRSLPVLRRLIAAGANIEDRNNLQQTPLAVCADRKLAGHMLTLIKAGAQVDTRDYQGDTALNRAAQWGNIRVVKVLVGRGGAHTDVANDAGLTPHQSALARLEEVKKFPSSEKYAEHLDAAEQVVDFMALAHEEKLIKPFTTGIGHRITIGPALQLKMKPKTLFLPVMAGRAP